MPARLTCWILGVMCFCLPLEGWAQDSSLAHFRTQRILKEKIRIPDLASWLAHHRNSDTQQAMVREEKNSVLQVGQKQ